MPENTQPAVHAVAVDISVADFDMQDTPCSALYIGSTGNLSILTRRGFPITFTNVAAGSILPVGAKRVVRNTTTASGIVALYN